MRNEMNRVPFRTQTKKLFLKVGVLLCAVCLSTNLTWAGNYGYFYAYGENYNKYDGTAKGKVYVSTSESTPSSYSMARYNSKEYTSDNDGKIDMWLYAQPEEGWVFAGWVKTYPSGSAKASATEYSSSSDYTNNYKNEHGKIYNNASYSYASTANPYKISHTAVTKSGNSVSGDDYQAYRAHFNWDEATTMPAPTFGFNKEEKYTRKVPIPVGSTYNGVENNGAFSFSGYAYNDNGVSGYKVTITPSDVAHYDYTNNTIIADKLGDATVTIHQPTVYKSGIATPFIAESGTVTQLIKVIPDDPTQICEIGDTRYTFADAIAYANNHPDDNITILVIKDGTVPAGYYTLPKKATLLIPVDSKQFRPRTTIERVNENNTIPSATTGMYKTLTFAEGVHLDVFGAVEVGGRQNNYNNNGTGRPQGATYGLLRMQAGSTMTLEKGSNLYAWGFVTGEGDIDARRGSNVHEQFQVYDWEGGSQTLDMYGNSEKVFIINEYFIQNVEARTTYRPGSALYGYSGFVGRNIDKIKIIGVVGDAAAMFLMDNEDDSEDTWVRKSYKIDTDQQVYEINNSAKLGNLLIQYSGYDFDSKEYVLPLTHNMKIHLLTGEMNITQSTVLLPGAEIEVDKQSTITIEKNMALYLFDWHEWDAHIHQDKLAFRIQCRPDKVPTSTERDISSAEALGNAKLNVHGTFETRGMLFATETGSQIYSNNEDAGTIIFVDTVPDSTPDTMALYVHKYKKDDPQYYVRPTVPAKLLNSDESFATTASTPGGQSYCYMNDKWTMMTVDPDSSCFMVDNYGVYYAKPGDYVAISATKNSVTKQITGNPDHTYNDYAGTGRLFILADGCQWWEVENVDNLYHCLHPQNDTYYEWVDEVKMGDIVVTPAHWAEKRFIITWNNWNGEPVEDADGNPVTYELTYGSIPKFLSTNPTRPADADAIYTFTGWTPTPEAVTGDKTYTATYNKETRRYDILFKYEDGGVIERQFLPLGSIPTCSEQAELEEEKAAAEPTKNYILTWEPALSAVTGDAVYTAKWIDVDNNPGPFTITFKNYDNSVFANLTGETAVEKNTQPNPGSEPSRTETQEYTFAFAGWKAADGETYTTSNLPLATMDAIYTAVFTPTVITYTVNFYKEGTTVDERDEDHRIVSYTGLLLGANPDVPYCEKANTAQYTYWLEWENMETGEVGVGVPSVSGNADYVATFREEINRYKLNLISNNNAVCSFTGAGVYDYNTDVNVSVTVNDPERYHFEGWSDGVKSTTRRVNVKSDMELSAIVRDLTVEESLEATVGGAKAVAVSGKEYYNIIISSDGANSGELTGAVNDITLWGNAYFDLTPNGEAGTNPRAWYAVAVPWQVDPRTGIYNKDRERALGFGTEFDILYYDGKTRHEQGPVTDCWKFLEYDEDKMMYPGRLYMIHVTSNFKTIRFQKKARTDIGNTSVELLVNTGSEEDVNANWNGIANPTTYKVNLAITGGANKGFVYGGGLIGEDGWLASEVSDPFIVGKPMMVQVNQGASAVAVTPVASPVRRRMRQAYEDENEYSVEISSNGQLCDRIFVNTDEEKPNHYLIGKDLAKAGVVTGRAQMWVDRYDTKLSLNTVAPISDQAEYPISIYAPNAGEYVIEAVKMPYEGSTLYLTLDGEAIWNLSESAYTVSMERGTTKRYGLRISIKKAPEIATGVDEAVVDSKANPATKVLINDKVFIIRGENVYSIDGQLVK